MKKSLILSLVFLLNFTFSSFSQLIKIDGTSVAANINLPTWLKGGQILEAYTDVSSISVLEFAVVGTELEFSDVVVVTSTPATVPNGKVWKIESIHHEITSGGNDARWDGSTNIINDIWRSGGVGLGTTAVDASALMDIVSSNKGVLIPRVDIEDLQTAMPVANPTVSLLVYNTNVTSGEGYYYWNGNNWEKLVITGDIPIADGTETKINAGNNISMTGNGTTATPYVVNASVGDVLPIGTILPWHKNATGNPQTLPNDWVECNGSAYPAGGILTGNTPNLNTAGAGRFLRGSNVSGTLQDATFITTISSTSGSLITEIRNNIAQPFSPTINNYDPSTSTLTCPSGTDYRYVLSGDNGAWGPKTMPKNPIRPVNMSVVYIIKYK